MEKFELRVHIAAPSMVKDDARWTRVAENIFQFRQARRPRLTDSIIDLTREHSQEDTLNKRSDFTHAISSSGSRSVTSPWVDHANDLEHAVPIANAQIQSSTRKRTFTETSLNSNNAKRTRRTSFALAQNALNPTSRDPIASDLKTRKEAEGTPRPRTAPETTLLVPFTTSPKVRRSFSRSASLFTTRGCDSFTKPFSNSRIDETSFVNESSEASKSFEVKPLVALGSLSEDHSFETHRYPGNQEQLLSGQDTQDRFHIEAETTFRLSQTSIQSTALEMGTMLIRHTTSFTEIESEKSISNGKAITISTPSTETASDPIRHPNNSSPLAQRFANFFTPVVDLTTVESEEHAPQVTRRDVLGPVSSPLGGHDPLSKASKHVPSNEAHLAAIRTLPERVRCRASNTITSKPFTTAVPEYLQNMARKFNLVNHFLPVHAPASIRNVERGYWKLLIRIADFGVVVKARRSPLSSSQWSDRRFMLRQQGCIAETASISEGDIALKELIYPNIGPGTPTPWTVEEFMEFWEYLAKVIERGRAGHDVFATIKICEARQHESLLLEVRFYGWAETLSHLWLILYGVSSGLTARMPLQWFGPGQGALVTMSGQLNRGGTIGRWVEQKSGGDGYWGIERSWDGLDTSLSASK